MNIFLTKNQLSKKVIYFTFALLLSSFISFSQTQNKLNVLFIAVDDLKPDIGCFGDSLAITPNIDALAQRGMVFTNTQCQQAVCSPSRASLMTGRYPDQTKIWDLETKIRDMNPDILTIPQYFKQNGYTSLGVGKIYHGGTVDAQNDAPSWTQYGNPYQSKWYNASYGKPKYFYASPHAKDTISKLESEAVRLGRNKKEYVQEKYWPSNETTDVPYNAYTDGAIANVGIDYLNQVKSKPNPFFLAVGFTKPHLPFNAPKQFWDLHDREKFNIAEFQDRALNSPSIAYHTYGELRSYTDIPASGIISENKQLELIHAYYAAVSYTDYLVGMLINKLEENGLLDKTIIVLWGDHGWHLGDHGLWCKHSNFEQAVRAPLIIAYPNQPNKGQTYTHPAEFTDIATTLCDISGLPVPLDFEGLSLKKAIEDPEAPVRNEALSQYPRGGGNNSYMGYTVRTDRYRYTKWVGRYDFSNYTAELYDYQEDPLETKNLASVIAYSNIVSNLDSIVSQRIKIPSSQNKLYFLVKGINLSGDTINIKNAQVQFLEKEQQTDQNGETYFTHVDGIYKYKVNAKGYSTVSDSLQLQNDTVINLMLKKEYYQVRFECKAAWNNSWIDSAKVSFNGKTETSNAYGQTFFQDIPYDNYNVVVELNNGYKQTFNNIEIYSDTTIVLNVSEPTFKVQIETKNRYSLAPIYQCNVWLNDNTSTSNSEGIATFLVPKGKYVVKIEHTKYQSIQDTFEVNKDSLFYYQLSPAFSNIKFRIKEGTAPVNNANVTILNEAVLSTSLGISQFKDLPAFVQYNYKIEKSAYKPLNGELFLINDTTLNLQMEKLETFVSSNTLEEIYFWPNPFTNHLNLKNNSLSKTRIIIRNITGQKMNDFIIDEGSKKVLNTGNLKPGIYFILMKSESKETINKLIKQH